MLKQIVMQSYLQLDKKLMLYLKDRPRHDRFLILVNILDCIVHNELQVNVITGRVQLSVW